MSPLSLENNEEKVSLTGKAHNHLPPPLAFLPSFHCKSPCDIVGARREERPRDMQQRNRVVPHWVANIVEREFGKKDDGEVQLGMHSIPILV